MHACLVNLVFGVEFLELSFWRIHSVTKVSRLRF